MIFYGFLIVLVDLMVNVFVYWDWIMGYFCRVMDAVVEFVMLILIVECK